MRSESSKKEGALVISLDFEKYWGMRDKKSIEQYKENLSKVDEVVEKTLALFEKYDTRATWATVGFLNFDSLESLNAAIPGIIPTYKLIDLDPYRYIKTLTPESVSGTFHFARKSIEKIVAAEGQELATHTFSHLYFLEEGVSRDACKQDLLSAIEQAKIMGKTTNSIIFPRNQYNNDTLALLKEVGIRVYRGNEQSWLYKASKDEEQGKLRRALRLIDAMFNLVGHQTSKPALKDGLINIPSSRFLRPVTSLNIFDKLHSRRIRKSMLHAAKTHTTYHLWWHPHNFGMKMDENFNRLEDLLGYAQQLNSQYGFRSLNMQDFLRVQ